MSEENWQVHKNWAEKAIKSVYVNGDLDPYKTAAIIILKGEAISEETNKKNGHAEFLAIKKANNNKESDLSDCKIYVSRLPCSDCAEELIRHQILTIFYVQKEHADEDYNYKEKNGYGKFPNARQYYNISPEKHSITYNEKKYYLVKATLKEEFNKWTFVENKNGKVIGSTNSILADPAFIAIDNAYKKNENLSNCTLTAYSEPNFLSLKLMESMNITTLIKKFEWNKSDTTSYEEKQDVIREFKIQVKESELSEESQPSEKGNPSVKDETIEKSEPSDEGNPSVKDETIEESEPSEESGPPCLFLQ